MKLDVKLDLEDFEKEDGTTFNEDIMEAIKYRVVEEAVNELRRQEQYRYRYFKDLAEFAREAVLGEVTKTFNNVELIEQIKQKVISEIAEKVAAKKALAQSQFEIEKFANFTPDNRKYLMGLIDECIVKKFK